MVAYSENDNELFEDQWSVRTEKMARRAGWDMPSNRSRSARRASARTTASRRAARKVSKSLGGKHRRRTHTWH